MHELPLLVERLRTRTHGNPSFDIVCSNRADLKYPPTAVGGISWTFRKQISRLDLKRIHQLPRPCQNSNPPHGSVEIVQVLSTKSVP